jgi:hypothetical protein
MAKLEMDPAFNCVRGRLGNFVYRKNGPGAAMCKPPVRKPYVPTQAQLDFQAQFKDAIGYAQRVLADPQLAPRYRAGATVAGMRPFNFAFADFMKPPQVNRIDVTAYHGQIGEVIAVALSKEFELTSVVVKLLTPANVEVEQGAANLVGGEWRYTATTVVNAGTPLLVRVIAKDLPGHTGDRQFPIVVA